MTNNNNLSDNNFDNTQSNIIKSEDSYVVGFLEKYACLVDKCPVHCCSAWTIAVDKDTIVHWTRNHPELLNGVEFSKTPSDDSKMKMHSVNNIDECIFYTKERTCQIHAKYGSSSLPDICNYYPHLYKSFNEIIYLSATISCVAIAYIILDDEEDINFKYNVIQNYPIKKNRKDIYDLFRGYEMISNKINVLDFYHTLIEHINKYKNIKDFCVDFLYLSQYLDDNSIFATKLTNNEILMLNFEKSKSPEHFNKINIKFRMFYKDLLFEIIENIMSTNREFEKKLIVYIDVYKEKSGFLEDAFFQYSQDPDGANKHLKYIRRFIKAKLSQSIFPYGVITSHFTKFAIILAIEILIINLIFAIFFYHNSLDDDIVPKVIYTIDRAFYGRSYNKLFDKIMMSNLDKIENIFACFID